MTKMDPLDSDATSPACDHTVKNLGQVGSESSLPAGLTASLQAVPISRIAVVDDHGIVRYGYAQLINQDPGLTVCGMAGDERSGLELLDKEKPDLAIIDLSLTDGDGMGLIKTIVVRLPKIKILVISAHDENLFAHRVLAAGAAGYINKQNAPENLLEGIHKILDGGVFFSDAVTQRLQLNQKKNPDEQARHALQALTNRELQVFEQIGNGLSTRQIAETMYLSIKTIERHKENIKQKLTIANATQLVQHATGWVLGQRY